MSYIYLDRDLFSHELWDDRPYARGQAWVDLIGLAHFNPRYFYIRGIKIDVARGQLCKSQEDLAKRWGWGKRKVAKFLSDLLNDHQIEVKVHHRIAVITICKYEEYQDKRTTNSTTDCTTNSTTKRTSKKEGKESKGSTPLPPTGVPDAFWEMYPRQRRGDRDAADRAWARAVKKASPDEIMAGLKTYADSDDVVRGFAKGAAAWLNGSGWSNTYKAGAKPNKPNWVKALHGDSP